MKEATKNSLKDLLKIGVGMGTLIALMIYIPQGSIAQYVLAVLMITALVASIVWFTPAGNPIKKLIRKSKEDKK